MIRARETLRRPAWRPAPLEPLERNALALMISTGSTSVLGVVFWAVAARGYSAAAVGLASAHIAAMMLLASLAQLNLSTVFPRFLPTAGWRTRQLLTLGYAACITLAVVVSGGFVLLGGGRHFLSSPRPR